MQASRLEKAARDPPGCLAKATPGASTAGARQSKGGNQIDAKWIVRLQGKDYPLYGGILNEAHERGLASIETTLVQIPTEENGNVAIVKSRVTMKDGGVFEAYGDASPRNTNPKIATALLRLAETRSKGRALRDSVNCGQTMLEEIGDVDETPARHEHAAPAPRSPARHEPGYEETFVEGERTYRRADLVTYATQALEQAMQQGIRVETIVPYQATNEALVAFGRAIRPKLAVVKAHADGKQGEAEAKRAGVEVSA